MALVRGARLLAYTFASLLAACGGDAQLAGGGTGGTGMAMGTMSGYGSIFVNGVRYETGTTTLGGDVAGSGDADVRQAIKPGMVVQVEAGLGSGGSRSARLVNYRKQLFGPVASVDPLTILQQQVRVSRDTVLAGTDSRGSPIGALSDLEPGLEVEVSGHLGRDGVVYATLVEAKGRQWSTGTPYLVRGEVTASGTGDVRVGALAIATGGVFAVGDYIKAEGLIAQVEGKALMNARVASEPRGLIVEATGEGEVEIEGVVTAEYSPQSSTLGVNGMSVDVSRAKFDTEGGGVSGVAGLQLAQRLEVEGRWRNGVLVAEEIELRGEGVYEIVATPELNGHAANPDGVTGTLGLLGQTVEVTGLTSIDEKAEFFVQMRGYVGRLKIHAYRTGSGRLTATRIELKGPDDRVSLEGTVDGASIGTHSFTVGGIEVQAGEFPLPAQGAEVRVEGTQSGGVVVATRIKSED